MKRLLSILLALCLLVSAMPLAYAEGLSVDTEETVEIDGMESSNQNESSTPEPSETILENQDSPDIQEITPIKVSSYEELQAAVANAEDGDIIEISKQIIISGDAVIETDKHITLKRADNFTSDAYYCDAMFDIWAEGTLKGFEIVDAAENKQTIDLSGTSKVINCCFDGENVHEKPFIKVKSQSSNDDNVTISNCSFTNNLFYSVDFDYGSKGICELSTFIHNNSAGIYSCGNIELIDCTITDNWSGGIVAYSDTTALTNCEVFGNILADPEHGVGTDIYINGTLIITDNVEEEEGYYDEFTGNRLDLPYNYSGAIRLIYLSTDEATEYFSTKFEPKEPDPEEANPTPVDPPSEPEPQPPKEEDKDQQEPPQGQGNGNANKEPQEPSESPSKGNGDNNDIPLEDAPMLICGEAVIDTSRSVVLAGYGDGLLHEDDPLTRAQAAQIIYRLLTAESVEWIYTLKNTFVDCSATAWYNEAVSTIANAGIVVGCGNDLYCPNGLLTWAQALTILTRFTEIQKYDLHYISYDGWALQAVETAVALGWIEDSASLNVDAIITRGDFVDLFNGVLAMY